MLSEKRNIQDNDNIEIDINQEEIKIERDDNNTIIVPVKYWSDSQKKELQEYMKDRVDISAHIEQFTKFSDQLDQEEKNIYQSIYELSSKDIPEFIVDLKITSDKEVENFIPYITEKVLKVLTVLIYDHPEFWWLGSNSVKISSYYNISGNSKIYNVIINIKPIKSKYYDYTGERISYLNTKIEQIKNQIMKNISDLKLTRKYSILRYIHDYLITRNVYTLVESRRHIRNIYGIFVEEKSVCEAYAEAFQYIAQQYDINCIIARSSTHEWNYVKMDDNKWYVVDVTWDDPIFVDKDLKEITEPSGSNKNLNTNYFLTGTNNEVQGRKFSEEEDHTLIYSAYGGEYNHVDYPNIETSNYAPNEDDKKEINIDEFNKTFVSNKVSISLPGCTVSDGKCILTLDNATLLSANTYCIAENKIYLGSNSVDGACSVVYGDKNYNEDIVIFDVSTETNAILLNISNDEITNKLVLYDCAYNSCIQTYGYIQKNGEIFECGTEKTIPISSITECNENTVGKVMYTNVDGFQICVFEELKYFLNNNKLPSYALKKIGNNYHYIIKPYFTYDIDFFAGDYEYYNSTMIKTQENIAVLTMRNIQLPECDNTNCTFMGSSLKNNQVCIKNNIIYKMLSDNCIASYGNENGVGIKIFQKGLSFNDFKEVTNSLDTIIINPQESTPYFVIYDCLSTGCIQTSGYIKYKSPSEESYNFMSCYTDNPSFDIGCVKLYRDNSSDQTCDKVKAIAGTYIYDDESDSKSNFKLCYSSKISSKTVFEYITIPFIKNNNGIFLFTNDIINFPNTNEGNSVMVKIDNNSITLKKDTITTGYYINSGTIYTSEETLGHDALIYCSSDNNCGVVEAKANNIYIDSGNTGNIITCDSITCTSIKGSSLPGHAYINAHDTTKKTIFTCSNGICSNKDMELFSSNIYFIDGFDKTKIISCNSNDGCSSNAKPSTESVNISYVDGLDNTRIITCTISGCISANAIAQCSDISSSSQCKYNDEGTPKVIDENNYCIYSDGKIYKSTNNECEIAYGDTGKTGTQIFKNVESKKYSLATPGVDTANLIIYECDSTSCRQLISTFYLESNQHLYKCNEIGLCHDISTSFSKGYYYIGAPILLSSPSKLAYSNVISCSTANIPSTCSLIPIPNGYFIDKLNTDNIINCDGEVCFSDIGTSVQGYVYIDIETPGNIISCSSSPCISTPGETSNGYVYIDASDSKRNSLIICIVGSCSVFNVSAQITYDKLAYIDATANTNIITCTYENGCYSIKQVVNNSNLYFIYALDITKVIKCGSSQCTIENSGAVSTRSIENKFYLDGFDQSKMITCTTDGCFSSYTLTLCSSTEENDLCKYDDGGTTQSLPNNYYCISSDGLIYKSSTTPENNGNEINSCSSVSGDIILEQDINTSFYSSGVFGNSNNNLIFSCDLSQCSQYISTHYLYKNNKNNYLYQCDNNGICNIKHSISTGYYLTGSPTFSSTFPYISYYSLIQCNKSNNPSKCINTAIPTGDFINKLNNKSIIHCNGTTCISTNGNIIQGHGYIDITDSLKKTIITCSINKCISEDKYTLLTISYNNLYFIDATSTSNIIICTTSNCSSQNISNNLTEGQKLYFIDGTNITNIITCSNNGCISGDSGALSNKNAIYTDGAINGRTLTCTVNGCISSNVMTICTSVDPSTQCQYSNAETIKAIDNNKYCIYTNGKIYRSTDTACEIAYGDSDKTGTYIFKSNSNGYSAAVIGTDINNLLIYECDTTSCKQLLQTNYLYSDTNFYYCKNDGLCDDVTSKFGNNKWCYLMGAPTISKSYPYLQYTSLHLCEKSENKISCIPNMIDGSFRDDDNIKNIIICKENTCSSVGGNITTGHAYILSLNKKYVVICKIDVCSYVITEAEQYYIDGTNTQNLITCVSDKCSSTNNSSGTFIDATNSESLNTITCTDDGCISESECRVDSGKNCESDSYYVIKDTKSKILQTSGKEGYLYYCETSESACTAINSLGYYIDEATVYTCQLNQEDVLCTSGAKPKTICNDKSIGKLGVDEEDYSRMAICLNYNNEKHTPIAAKLTNNSLNYILKHDSNNDIFNLKNDSKYALISVNQSSITLNTSYKSTTRNLYVNKNAFNVLVRGNMCPNENILEEFICEKGKAICELSSQSND